MCLPVKENFKILTFYENCLKHPSHWHWTCPDFETPYEFTLKLPPTSLPFHSWISFSPTGWDGGGGKKRRQGSIWRVFHTMLLVLFKLKIRLLNSKVIKINPHLHWSSWLPMYRSEKNRWMPPKILPRRWRRYSFNISTNRRRGYF